jgi:hypothetical protein
MYACRRAAPFVGLGLCARTLTLAAFHSRRKVQIVTGEHVFNESLVELPHGWLILSVHEFSLLYRNDKPQNLQTSSPSNPSTALIASH